MTGHIDPGLNGLSGSKTTYDLNGSMKTYDLSGSKTIYDLNGSMKNCLNVNLNYDHVAAYYTNLLN